MGSNNSTSEDFTPEEPLIRTEEEQHKTPEEPPTPFTNDWRTVNWSDKEQMLQKLREFQTPEGLDHLRILVVGPVYVGKTTFITSVNTTIQDTDKYLPSSLFIFPTIQYHAYKMKKGTDGSYFSFVFGDTMGLEDIGGAHPEDIIKILQGHVQDGFDFNSGVLDSESNYYIKTPTLNDKVHCLVFVISADRVSFMSNKDCNKIKLIRQQAHNLGIPQAVIMSRVDLVCPLVKDDLKMIYNSTKIKEMMEECKSKVGVPLNYIFPVKNYHEEISRSVEVEVLLLTAVMNIVDLANDFVKRNL